MLSHFSHYEFWKQEFNCLRIILLCKNLGFYSVKFLWIDLCPFVRLLPAFLKFSSLFCSNFFARRCLLGMPKTWLGPNFEKFFFRPKMKKSWSLQIFTGLFLIFLVFFAYFCLFLVFTSFSFYCIFIIIWLIFSTHTCVYTMNRGITFAQHKKFDLPLTFGRYVHFKGLYLPFQSKRYSSISTFWCIFILFLVVRLLDHLWEEQVACIGDIILKHLVQING